MRIAMVSEHASPLAALGGVDAGGQNVYVARLADLLADRGHQVTVYTRRDDPALPERVPLPSGAVVEHVTAGPARVLAKDDLFPHMPEFGRHLAGTWRRTRPDVVHAHFWMSGMAALAGAEGLGVPVVQTYHALGTVKRRHQGAADTSPPERLGIEQRIGQSCAAILATCSDEVRELARMGLRTARCKIVPCGVDTARFTARGAAARTPARTERHRLLTVGRLVPRKGIDVALTALTRVPDTELLVAGGPPADRLAADPEAQRLLALAHHLGVAERFHLLGSVPHLRMPALIRSADVVLCTPAYEPFGIVPVEAMACGTPVVATDVGGHRDTVVHHRTGLLVPPGAPVQLASAVRGLLADPERLRAYGHAGRLRALSQYRWERVADGVEAVYARVTATDPIPSGAR
ncbi:glycosyltransferase [Streptomyces sp. NPDC049577]|uniref:glycosyltransferase n=1 Tax=Streptomyces sp. NPDC049577 TaxID=3155153 RepID=UPI003429FB6E